MFLQSHKTLFAFPLVVKSQVTEIQMIEPRVTKSQLSMKMTQSLLIITSDKIPTLGVHPLEFWSVAIRPLRIKSPCCDFTTVIALIFNILTYKMRNLRKNCELYGEKRFVGLGRELIFFPFL